MSTWATLEAGETRGEWGWMPLCTRGGGLQKAGTCPSWHRPPVCGLPSVGVLKLVALGGRHLGAPEWHSHPWHSTTGNWQLPQAGRATSPRQHSPLAFTTQGPLRLWLFLASPPPSGSPYPPPRPPLQLWGPSAIQHWWKGTQMILDFFFFLVLGQGPGQCLQKQSPSPAAPLSLAANSEAALWQVHQK